MAKQEDKPGAEELSELCCTDGTDKVVPDRFTTELECFEATLNISIFSAKLKVMP
jgi:hypothetical protein